MKRTSFIQIALLFILFGCDNSKINSKKTYIEETTSFLNYEKVDKISIISSEPILINKYNCLESIKNDTINFSKSELDQILKEAKNPQIKEWKDSYFENGKVINNDTIKDIFKENSNKGWSYFYKKFGDGIKTISAPIFLRNYNYCLIYFEYDCGKLCGHGSLNLFKKENGKWKIIKTYCPWIS